MYIGKAQVLHEELGKHFDCFNKTREEIREIDDELCHHTEMSGWDLTVWLLEVSHICGSLLSQNKASLVR